MLLCGTHPSGGNGGPTREGGGAAPGRERDPDADLLALRTGTAALAELVVATPGSPARRAGCCATRRHRRRGPGHPPGADPAGRDAGRPGHRHVAYGVAHRIAVRLQQHNRLRPPSLGDTEPAAAAAPDPSWREACDVLHAELDQLPDCYRLPLLLCYLEGQTRDEAADALGLSAGTVKGRIRRGIEMLRRRLERRGVSLSAGLLAAVAAGEPLAANEPVTLQLNAASSRAHELATELTMRTAVWKWAMGLAAILAPRRSRP